MIPKFVFLWTDLVLYVMVIAVLVYGWRVRKSPNLRANWKRVFNDAPALASSVVLGVFLMVTLLDSVHYRRALPPSPTAAPNTPVAYDTRTTSLLDVMLQTQINAREASYSQPLDYQGFTKESKVVDGKTERVFPRLVFGGAHLKDPQKEWAGDVITRALTGLAFGVLGAIVVWLASAALYARRAEVGFGEALGYLARNETRQPLRAGLLTATVICLLIGPTVALMTHYHVLGTDRTGNDVLVQALKSVRTAFVIGTLSTVATLPLAVGFGVAAGYFRGWVDEVVQYLYTLLTSIPPLLLIAACVLMLQVFMDKHPDAWDTAAERADVRIFLLCVILGLTGWASLCRLLRAETMKLRELDFVQAATAFGVSHARIMARHIFPNVLHLVLITTVLAFSDLILFEAVLSYVGVGVDPSMNSFGGMINLARSEMSRDPVVWWSFAAAFAFMVTLVLAANLFSDGVRDAFDPRARSFRPRRVHASKKAA